MYLYLNVFFSPFPDHFISVNLKYHGHPTKLVSMVTVGTQPLASSPVNHLGFTDGAVGLGANVKLSDQANGSEPTRRMTGDEATQPLHFVLKCIYYMLKHGGNKNMFSCCYFWRILILIIYCKISYR